MQNIANAKYGIDNLNFFTRTTAGNTYVVLLTVLGNAVGHTFFFKMIFTDRITEYNADMGVWLPYLIGFFFSLLLSAGTYFSIMNGYKQLATVLFWVSIVLSISTYSIMLLSDIPSFELVNDEGIGKFNMGKKEVLFVLKCFGVFALALTPDYIAKEISKEISKKYETDSYMKALDLQLTMHQEMRIEKEMKDLSKAITSNEDDEMKKMQEMMKALGRKQQRTPSN